MPQKPLDASDTTQRLTLRLPKRLTDQIDLKRGTFTRSEYMRQMIEIGLLAMQDEPLAEHEPWMLRDVEPLQNETKAMPKIVPAKKPETKQHCDHPEW